MLMHPYNTKGSKRRLLNDYFKYGNLVIGFDFDNTIYKYSDVKLLNEKGFNEIINLLKKAQKYLCCTMCLFTTETDDEKLKWKVEYTKKLGIRVDYVNFSPLSANAIKPHFNILLDDRAGLESAYETLKYVVNKIEKLIKNNGI